jgi:hypothetical protein
MSPLGLPRQAAPACHALIAKAEVAGRPDVPRQFDEGQGKDRFVTDGLQTPGSSDGQAAARSGAVTSSSSTAQRLEALRRANEIRIGRAQLKRALAAGSVRVSDILAAPPECARTQKVQALLLALPKYGPARVARLLAQCQISSAKTLAGLSERQRAELIRRL